MIFVCGDTHGEIDFHKLNSKNFPIGKTLTSSDYVIVCGDMGILWGGDNTDKYLQKWYSNKPWTTLFVDGNHENFHLLNKLPIEEWCGGKVHFVSPKIIHLMRGQVFTIDGYKFFTMGGATSRDKIYRVEGTSWWADEMPSRQEYDEAIENLIAAGGEVDYIISHDCDTETLLKINPYYIPNELTQFLYRVKNRPFYLKYKHHYFGHHHIDRQITEKETCLYQNIISITGCYDK